MTTDTVQNNGAPEAAALPPPRVRMDRSRAYSTIHGERGPGDKHAGVMFRQDGIPADASGYFIFDHPDMLEPGPEGDKRRKAAAKKIERARVQAAKAPPPPPPSRADADSDDDEEVATDADGEEEGLLEPINLEEWLRGEQQVEWQEVTQEIARRYKKRVAKIEDAVAFLVKEGVVPKAQLKKAFQKFAD
jgi:hypothetical protein